MPKITRTDADRFEKHGIELWDYLGEDGPETGDVLYLETGEGHLQEFRNTKCDFFYYVLDGDGAFYLDGDEEPVGPGDLVHVPAGTAVYYLGEMDLLLFCSPSWTPEQEEHIRYIDADGNTVERSD